jgi:hypothetical protein
MSIVGVDAAIWTALPSNWLSRRGKEFSITDAKHYLDELSSGDNSAYARAAEYIRKTPAQIETALRVKLQHRESFKTEQLPSDLFEHI